MQISLSKRGMAEFDASAFSTKEERDMLYTITKLDVSYNSLSAVKGMQCLSNLTSLDISYNKVRTLSGLPLKLRRLNVAHNELKYLDGLTPLSQLEWIDVSFNELVSLSGLPGTQGLHVVDASHNKIGNLKGVELCTGIHELNVTHNLLRKVDDLIPLRYLRAIRQLSVTDNPVTVNPRNFTAIRLLVPTIQHLEGASAAAATLATSTAPGVLSNNSSSVAALTAFTSAPHYHQLHDSSSVRPRSPALSSNNISTTRPSTPNASTIVNSSVVSKAPSPNRGAARTSSPRNGKEASLVRSKAQLSSTASHMTTHSQSLYQSLLKSLDSVKSQHHDAHFTAPRSASADAAARQNRSVVSPRRGLTLLSSSSVTQQSFSSAESRKYHSSVVPQQIHDASSIGRSLQDSSTSAIAVQRLLEERIVELERDLKDARKKADDSSRDADNYKLQVKQLKDTVERQAKVNAMLSDANRQLSIEATRLQLNAPKISIAPSQANNANGATNAAIAASIRRQGETSEGASGDIQSSGRRASTPDGGRTSPHNRSPKTTALAPGSSGYASKAAAHNAAAATARGSISGSGSRQSRRADMSPKRGSMMSDVRELVPQTGQPSFVAPLSATAQHKSPQRPLQSRGNISVSAKNVSFGGSQFYSPPQHYY